MAPRSRRRRWPRSPRSPSCGASSSAATVAACRSAAPCWASSTRSVWVAYAVHQGLWSAAPEAVLMTVSNGVLVVVAAARPAPLGGGARRAPPARGRRRSPSWPCSAAPAAVGVVLGAAYGVQVAPAVWTAWRTASPRASPPRPGCSSSSSRSCGAPTACTTPTRRRRCWRSSECSPASAMLLRKLVTRHRPLVLIGAMTHASTNVTEFVATWASTGATRLSEPRRSQQNTMPADRGREHGPDHRARTIVERAGDVPQAEQRSGREQRPPIVDDAAQEAEEHTAERQLLHHDGRQRDHDEGSPQHRPGARRRRGRRRTGRAAHGTDAATVSARLTTRNACSPHHTPVTRCSRARPSSAAVILAASAAPARHGISARLTAVCASSGTTVLRRTRKPASSPTTATSATTSRHAVVAPLNSSPRGRLPAGRCRRRSSRRVGRRPPRR